MSSEHNHTKSALAGGANIRRNRVVYLSDQYTVLEMSLGGTSFMPFGITQDWSRKAPGTPFDTSLIAANTGDEVLVYTPGSMGLAECGGTVTAGVPISNDSTARIINSVFGNAPGLSFGVSWGWELGYALESGAAGDVIRVYVQTPIRAYRAG